MIPENIPAVTDNGTEIIVLMISGDVPRESPRKTEKIVIAKTSSIEAPAKIIVGTSFFLPLPFSLRFSIEGTMTAGETAASMKPVSPLTS